MTTLAELATYARRSPQPSREDRRVAARALTSRTQASHPIVVTTPAEVTARAKAIAEAILSSPVARRRLLKAGIKLPPLKPGAHQQAASTVPAVLPAARPRVTGPSTPVRSSFTPKAAVIALNELREDIRREGGHPTLMEAFALACERRPDLAEAAGIGGAGMASLNTWMSGSGRTHAEGCACGGNGTCAGWQPAQ